MKLSQLYFEVKLTAKICMELVTIVKRQKSIPNLKKFVINFYSWFHWSKDHVKNQTKDVQDLIKKVYFQIQMDYVNGNKKTTNNYPDSHFMTWQCML